MPLPLNQIDPTTVFIVMAAFNEEATIENVVEDLLALHFRIVVVDDGSTQSLEELLKGKPLYLLRHQLNLGQGAALQTGIEFALQKGAAYIVTFDADGQHTAASLQNLFSTLQVTGADIVLGSRFLQSPGSTMPFWRKQVLQVARWVNYLFTGLYLTDAHNGLRLLSRAAARKIVLRENGMAHATELLWQIKKQGLRYSEAPVDILYTNYSLQKGQTAWSGFRIVLDLLLHKLFR